MNPITKNNELIRESVASGEIKGKQKDNKNKKENEPNEEIEIVDSNHINNQILENNNNNNKNERKISYDNNDYSSE